MCGPITGGPGGAESDVELPAMEGGCRALSPPPPQRRSPLVRGRPQQVTSPPQPRRQPLTPRAPLASLRALPSHSTAAARRCWMAHRLLPNHRTGSAWPRRERWFSSLHGCCSERRASLQRCSSRPRLCRPALHCPEDGAPWTNSGSQLPWAEVGRPRIRKRTRNAVRLRPNQHDRNHVIRSCQASMER